MAKSFSHDIEVRWGDLDALNHVNNTLFLRYLEEARIRLFDTFPGGWTNDRHGPVVVNINMNFRREIRYPATVRVDMTAHAASGKRMRLEHTLRDAGDPEVVYGDAEITVVWVDYASRRSIALPDTVRDAVGD